MNSGSRTTARQTRPVSPDAQSSFETHGFEQYASARPAERMHTRFSHSVFPVSR
jgi:hypothetical protein